MSQPIHRALVCGSDNRLAEAVASRLAADGVAVAILATAGASASDLESRMKIPVFSWDIGDYQACEEGMSSVNARLGSVDILVNSAGVFYDCPLQELTQPMWRNVIKVNLGGCFNMAKIVMHSMREHRFGRIVTIVSSEDAASSVANRAAAAALQGFTRGLALEGQSVGVTANLVAIGSRALQAGSSDWLHDVAHSVAFLCTGDSAHITASMLTIGEAAPRDGALGFESVR